MSYTSFVEIAFLNYSSLALSEAMKADHGFNVESRSIRDLLEVMSEYDSSTRREFLQFITGSPKLPIGGTYLDCGDYITILK